MDGTAKKAVKYSSRNTTAIFTQSHQRRGYIETSKSGKILNDFLRKYSLRKWRITMRNTREDENKDKNDAMVLLLS